MDDDLTGVHYCQVETTLNTGNNLRKELERLEEVQLFYKFRNDEIFRRININNLVSQRLHWRKSKASN